MEEEYNPAIYVYIMSAKGIRDVNWFTKMDVYAEVWIEGGVPKNKKRTCVLKGCGTSPKWKHNRLELKSDDDHPIRNRSLVVQLMAKRYRWPTDKIIGFVTIPIKDLFEGFHTQRYLLFNVCMKSGKTQGLLKLYYDFGSVPLETNAQAEQPPMPDYETQQRMLYEQFEWPEEADSAEEADSWENSMKANTSSWSPDPHQASRVVLQPSPLLFL